MMDKQQSTVDRRTVKPECRGRSEDRSTPGHGNEAWQFSLNFTFPYFLLDPLPDYRHLRLGGRALSSTASTGTLREGDYRTPLIDCSSDTGTGNRHIDSIAALTGNTC